MDRELDAMGMLDLMVSPGFCVKNGIIIKCNAAAQGILLREGMEIAPMLATGTEEYAEFSSGCLYLILNISGVLMGTSVTRMGDFDVFLPEEDAAQSELQAVALAARELREPLAGIMTTVERMFPLRILQEDPAMQDQAARLNRGLYQMLRIIGNMSDAGRYASAAAAQLETMDIPAFLQEIFARAQEPVSHAGITLRFENLPHSLYALADSEKLERAVMNILSNALKFTPPGGSIDAKLTRKGKRLYLSVQDSGTGIPDALRGSIHRRYLRQPGIDDSRQGIGLGMVLIRSAAAIHGGTVLIDHPEDAGTRITMTLAIRQDASGSVRSGRSPLLRIDYTGERDHALLELAESLPASLYEKL